MLLLGTGGDVHPFLFSAEREVVFPRKRPLSVQHLSFFIEYRPEEEVKRIPACIAHIVGDTVLLATSVVCKDNTSNDPFSRCESVQEFGYR